MGNKLLEWKTKKVKNKTHILYYTYVIGSKFRVNPLKCISEGFSQSIIVVALATLVCLQ